MNTISQTISALVVRKHWSNQGFSLAAAWRRSSSYLGQLQSDPLKVLRAPGVEADGAAGVHLAERHLLRRGAVIGLDMRGLKGGGVVRVCE